MDKKDLIKKIEFERGVAFLTLANTGDAKQDYAYEQVAAYIDKILEIVKAD